MELYRKMLLEAYEEKKLSNSLFSMNSYAKFIGLSPSQFNEVIKGKCGLSVKRASQISKRLQFTELQDELFCLSVERTHSRSLAKKKDAQKKLQTLQKDKSTLLQSELFALVSGWYHFAILELMNLDDFEAKEAWISKRLNVDQKIVKEAVKRLKKLGLIKVKGSQWIRQEGLVHTTNDVPSIAIKKYHSQMLNLGEKALQSVDVEQREYNSTFLSIDEKLIPEAKKRIRKFQMNMIKDLSLKSNNKNTLFSLSIQMFPLTKV